MPEIALMDNLWIMICAVLVLFMQGGFILLEAGSTRMKNAGHIAGKTIFTVGIASLVYWAVGWGFATVKGTYSLVYLISSMVITQQLRKG